MVADHQNGAEYNKEDYKWQDIEDQELKYAEDWRWQYLNLQNLPHQGKIMLLDNMDNPEDEDSLIMASN